MTTTVVPFPIRSGSRVTFTSNGEGNRGEKITATFVQWLRPRRGVAKGTALVEVDGQNYTVGPAVTRTFEVLA